MPYGQRPDPTRPHRFVQRLKGGRNSCRICGGTEGDVLHQLPKRRIEDRRHK